MSIDTWAAANGQTPRAQSKADEWFSTRPQLVDEARAAYAAGWSWAQIRAWLEQEHGYPLKDEKSVTKVCR